ncbi:transposase [Pandoraea horticolens]|uniref:Transposase n=1 Tax=Pandoraea horticolens TaxID=2508298 RepID=A0A5E4VFH6_9BURK|nr:transposase [Pandoraea horticolens]
MDVLTGPERRRRWTAEQKMAMVRESLEPGKTVSLVARQHGVNPNQLFHWRKLYQGGSLSAVKAGEEVVPASELADALKQIRELQRMLGKKVVENEILREAVEYGRAKKGSRTRHCCRATSSETGLRSSRCVALERFGTACASCRLAGWSEVQANR